MELDQIIVRCFLLLVYLVYLGVSIYFLVRTICKLRTKDKFIFLEAIFLTCCFLTRSAYIAESLLMGNFNIFWDDNYSE